MLISLWISFILNATAATTRIVYLHMYKGIRSNARIVITCFTSNCCCERLEFIRRILWCIKIQSKVSRYIINVVDFLSGIRQRGRGALMMKQ